MGVGAAGNTKLPLTGELGRRRSKFWEEDQGFGVGCAESEMANQADGGVSGSLQHPGT